MNVTRCLIFFLFLALTRGNYYPKTRCLLNHVRTLLPSHEVELVKKFSLDKLSSLLSMRLSLDELGLQAWTREATLLEGDESLGIKFFTRNYSENLMTQNSVFFLYFTLAASSNNDVFYGHAI